MLPILAHSKLSTQATGVFVGLGQFQDAGFRGKRVNACPGLSGSGLGPATSVMLFVRGEGKRGRESGERTRHKISKGIWKNEDH